MCILAQPIADMAGIMFSQVQEAHAAGKIARDLAERSAVPIPLGRRITPEATSSIPAPL